MNALLATRNFPLRPKQTYLLHKNAAVCVTTTGRLFFYAKSVREIIEVPFKQAVWNESMARANSPLEGVRLYVNAITKGEYGICGSSAFFNFIKHHGHGR